MTATVRLVDRKLRIVEVLGPELPGSRHPTDRRLLYRTYGMMQPMPIGTCYQADGRVARFILDEGSWGDALLDKLATHRFPARPAKPYGTKAYLVEG